MSRSLKICAQVESEKIVAGYSAVYPTALQNENFVDPCFIPKHQAYHLVQKSKVA